MRSLALLLGVRFHAARNRTRALRFSDLPSEIASFIVFGGFALFVFVVARSATVFLLKEAHDGLSLLHRFLSAIHYVLFITVNIGNAIVCYATLYKSEETSFLMSLPIPPGQVFLARFIDNFLVSSFALVLLSFSLFLGYASVFPFGWQFYIAATLLVYVPALLLAGLTAVLIIVMLVSVASSLGMRRLAAVSIAAYALLTYVCLALTNPVSLASFTQGSNYAVAIATGESVPTGIMLLQLLPSTWISDFLYRSMAGEPEAAYSFIGLIWGSTVILGAGAWAIGRWFFYPSWLAATEANTEHHASRKPLIRLRFLEFTRHSFGSRQTDVLLKRDFWMFLRDPGQWVHLVLMVVLLGAFMVSVPYLDFGLNRPLMRTISYVSLLLLDGFLVASIALRFIFPSISMEGDAFWCIRSAPVDLGLLYRQKFSAAFVLLLVVAQILGALSVAVAHDILELMITGTVTMGCAAFAISSINLAAGARFASFREKSAVRVASTRGATVTFLVTMAYLALVNGLLGVSVYRYFTELEVGGSAQPVVVYAPLGLIALISLIIGSLCMLSGIRDFNRDY